MLDVNDSALEIPRIKQAVNLFVGIDHHSEHQIPRRGGEGQMREAGEVSLRPRILLESLGGLGKL